MFEVLPRLKEIPSGVWVLGFVSLLMDISSEMIHALLPVYLVTVLGASALAVGVIEGVAEATAMIVKIFSGALSDWLGRRKLLAVIGYGLAAFSKPIFPLASAVKLDRRRPLHRSHRQGHSRRAARCADCRSHAAAFARRQLRSAPGARHRRRVSRTAHGDRPDAVRRRQHHHRVLDRGYSSLRVFRADGLGGQGAGTAAASRGAARACNSSDLMRFPSAFWIVGRGCLRALRSRASAKRFWCCAHRTWGCRSRSSRL